MRGRRRGWSGAAILAVLAGAGCAARGQAGSPAASPAGGMSAAEIEAVYRERTASARTRFTPADVEFMTGMIGHHAQALVMSALVPERSATPSIHTLAARITNAQRDEIATMQRWLRVRAQPVPDLHGEGAGLMVHGAGDHAHHMPGMLTPEQLRGLERARGPEFDRLFLQYMIQHHKGAVTMVHELFATDGAGQDEEVFRFASDAQVDQATEVARMKLMLAALGAPAGKP